jgi:hypothetical protein
MTSEKTFNDYDWDAIADAIGTKVLARQSDNVEIRARRGQRGPGGVEVLSIIIAENGGELNIFAVVPLVSESVPYWSNAHPGGAVGDMTLASRLNQALAGEPIDYDIDLDTEDTSPLDPDVLLPTRQITEGERRLLQHISQWGSEGYPIQKVGRGWTWGADGVRGPPVLFKTKREAIESFEKYLDILRASVRAGG